MAHAGSSTQQAIPDPGDPHEQADTQVSAYLDQLEQHTHSGATGDYQPLGASGLAIDGAVDWNDNDLTGLSEAGFDARTPASLDDQALGVDSAGDLYYKPPSPTGAVQITSGGALNTAAGNGITGMAAPAGVTYTSATGEYRFQQDTGTGLDGSMRALRIRADGAGTTGYSEIRAVGTGGALALAEENANFEAILRMPIGWDDAASADIEAFIPPESVIANIAGGTGIVSPGVEMATIAQGSWTPTITAGVTNPTYVTQRGAWTRIGHMVFISFDISWSAAGSASGTLTIGTLPYATASTARSITLPVLPVMGVASDLSGDIKYIIADGGDFSLYGTTGSITNGSTSEAFQGTLMYMTA